MQKLISELDRRIAAYMRLLADLPKHRLDDRTRADLAGKMSLDMSMREQLRGNTHAERRH